MAEICFLGTGGSVATEDRDNTSILMVNRDDLILIDCPGSPFQKIKKLGLDPRRVSSLLVTHVHPDHIYGLPMLVHSLMMEKLRIKLYGSQESVFFCRQLLNLFNLQDEKIKCRIDFISLTPEKTFDLHDSLSCRTLEVPHKSSSLAFFFNFKGEKKEVIYSGDTPAFSPLFKHGAGVDTLIHDCSVPSRFFQEVPHLSSMHTNALELGKLAQSAGIKRLLPCHFFVDLDFSVSEIETEIRQNYTGELIVPRDFSRISL